MQGCHQKWEGSRDPLAVRPFCASCFVNCDQLKTENKYFLTDSNIIVWLTKVINCNKYVTRCWKSHLRAFQISNISARACTWIPSSLLGGSGCILFSILGYIIYLLCNMPRLPRKQFNSAALLGCSDHTYIIFYYNNLEDVQSIN